MTINKDIELPKKADIKINVAEVFNIETKLSVKGFKNKSDLWAVFPTTETFSFRSKV